MRLFDETEITDLSELINKPENDTIELSAQEADTANEFLRKNYKFYINSHMILLSEKTPKSMYLNIALDGMTYDKKLENLLEKLQAPYRIFLGQ